MADKLRITLVKLSLIHISSRLYDEYRSKYINRCVDDSE